MTTPPAASTPPPAPPPALDETSRAFLTDELARLQALYTHMEGSAQGVFNFYLTFVTTVVGAVIVLAQLEQNSAGDVLRLQLTIAALLFFTAIVGSVYLSALSGRYAHMARFAGAVDALRYFLVTRLAIQTPPIYAAFRAASSAGKTPDEAWHVWLFPTGTYQLFIGLVNSAALAVMTLLLTGIGGANIGLGSRMVGAGLVLVSAILIYNVYSHWVMRSIMRRLHVQVNTQAALNLLAGRQ